MKNIVRFFCITALLVSVTGSVFANPQAEEDAIKSAEQWLALVDNQEYAQSYQEAASEFKKVVQEDGWVAAMESVRKPLGEVVSRKILAKRYMTTLPNAPEGEYVVIQYVTSYTNKASAVETITPMLDIDDQWRVSGYYIK